MSPKKIKDTQDINDYSGIKVAAVSLGCSKNRIDTEEVLGRLAEWGCQLVEDCSMADIVVVNTCGFIEDAQQESIDTLLETAAAGKRNQKVVAAGCLVEVFGEKLLETIPEISAAIGVHSYKKLNQLMDSLINNKRVFIKEKPGQDYEQLAPRILTEPPHSVNVKIAEGCNNCCNYCLIPKIRGHYRSRPPEKIIEEIRSLVQKGTKEINLIAQDTTWYGKEREDFPDLEGLIRQILISIAQPFRLRIMYTYPSHITDGLIDLIAEEKRVCSYLDIPIQHASDQVLESMGRNYRRSDLELLLYKLRSRIPGLTIRTTCMVGYPGENSVNFKELLDFIRESRLEKLGAFCYSAQEGTEAYNLNRSVPKRVSKKRLQKLMLTQQQVALKENMKLNGQLFKVLIDSPVAGNGWYYGRSCHQAPDVDGGIFFHSKKKRDPGQLVEVKIIAASPYNLMAVARDYGIQE
ncbi:MAG: 30S ribosomal protein S12 methylthiotransferase RimO [Bacillota bacterium]